MAPAPQEGIKKAKWLNDVQALPDLEKLSTQAENIREPDLQLDNAVRLVHLQAAGIVRIQVLEDSAKVALSLCMFCKKR